MRILITGAGGFVGPYLIRELVASFGKAASIVATSRTASSIPGVNNLGPLDITDSDAIDVAVRDIRPTHVIHLAAISSPPEVDSASRTAWLVNTVGTVSLAETIIRRAPQCCLVFAGSGLVYGDSAKSGRMLDEAALLAPNSHYAATKAAADLALGALVPQGLRSIRLRLFNHTGPGQAETFVVPGFAAQIARIEAGLQPPVMRVGNLDAVRDFLDVRDVATAYALAVRRAADLSPGTILNIASQAPRSIQSIFDDLVSLSQVAITSETDPSRMRPNETPFYAGDAAAAARLLGWRPRYAFPDTLRDVLAYWRGESRRG